MMKASRKYTAQEMRKMADKLDGENSEYAICLYDKRDDEWRPLWMNPDSAVLALRYAAGVVERCEREIKRKKALAAPSCANCANRCIGRPNNEACDKFIESGYAIECKAIISCLTYILRGDVEKEER